MLDKMAFLSDHICTRLMWQQGEGGSMTWKDAISYCVGLTLAGHTDWRLPSKKELISIVNYGTYSPSIDTTYFPGTNAKAYWSSITYAHSSSYAWGVYFVDGFADYIFKGIYGRDCVRCVRGGQ